MILNAIKGLMGVIFPIITYPYIYRVLGVENIGKYNFSDSYISYFVLLAGLGVGTYAIREGARVRNNKNETDMLTSEIFTINTISMVVSYLFLLLSVLYIPKFYSYKALMLVLSLQVIFKTIGIEWIYSIYEDYTFVTIRSIIFQIIPFVAMFIFVKKPEDTVIYAWIVVISSGISNIINFLYSRKYCKIKLTGKLNLKQHLKPILILFAMTATVTIYVSSDIFILGLLCDDVTVGIYTVSTKIYTVIKTVLSSVLIVSIPRLSSLLGKDDMKEFNDVANDVYKTLFSVMIPSMVGLILLRKVIIIKFFGEKCAQATSSTALLSIALIFCMGAWFWGQCIMVPMKQDGKIFSITVVSALINIVLNLIMIPFWKENAAAFTTILAEAISFTGTYIIGRKYVKINGFWIFVLKIGAGCIGVVLCTIGLKYLISNTILYLIADIILSIIIYLLIEVLVRNEALIPILKKIRKIVSK